MKKSLLLTLLIFLVTYSTASSQTEKGKYLVGAASTLDFKFSFIEPDKELDIYFAPQAGYFVADQLALGVTIPGRIRHYFSFTNVTTKSVGISLGPFLRYYLGPPKKIMPFIAVGVDYGMGRVKREIYDEDRPVFVEFEEEVEIIREFGAEASFGFSFFITPTIGLNSQLGYEYSDRKFKGDDFSFPQHDIQILVGFDIFL